MVRLLTIKDATSFEDVKEWLNGIFILVLLVSSEIASDAIFQAPLQACFRRGNITVSLHRSGNV